MWITFSFLSAFFAGITAILSKIGVKNIKSETAVAIRTVVVFVFAWLMVFIKGIQNQIFDIDLKTMVFLFLSGTATGASWICCFKALQKGNVNQVAPIDKSSTILTVILAFIIFDEPITKLKIFCIVLIAVGTYLMIEKRNTKAEEELTKEELNIIADNGKIIKSSSWFIWAVLSAVFAALTSVLGKIGVSGIDSDLGTAVRTSVVVVMAWLVAFISGGCRLGSITKRNLFFLIISGVTTGMSWLCYYRALKDGIAGVVVPIDKLSILVTVVFSRIVLKERLTTKSSVGLILLTIGTLLLLA